MWDQNHRAPGFYTNNCYTNVNQFYKDDIKLKKTEQTEKTENRRRRNISRPKE